MISLPFSLIATSLGDITVELCRDHAPVSVENPVIVTGVTNTQ